MIVIDKLLLLKDVESSINNVKIVLSQNNACLGDIIEFARGYTSRNYKSRQTSFRVVVSSFRKHRFTNQLFLK